MDGGLTFDRQCQGMNAASIDSLIVDPSNALILYAGYHWYGFFTGKNGEKRWSLTDEFYYGEDIRQIWVNPSNSDDILVLVRCTSTNKYLLRSFDRGRNWERIFEEDANCFLVDPNNPDVILAFGRFPQGTNYYMGMYESTDGGNSWKSKKISKLEGEVFCTALSPDGNTLYAGGNEGQGYDLNATMYQSFNNGQSWKKLIIPSDSYSVNAIYIDPNTPAYVYAGLSYGGVLRSRDSGATWLNSTINTDGFSDGSQGSECFDRRRRCRYYLQHGPRRIMGGSKCRYGYHIGNLFCCKSQEKFYLCRNSGRQCLPEQKTAEEIEIIRVSDRMINTAAADSANSLHYECYLY